MDLISGPSQKLHTDRQGFCLVALICIRNKIQEVNGRSCGLFQRYPQWPFESLDSGFSNWVTNSVNVCSFTPCGETQDYFLYALHWKTFGIDDAAVKEAGLWTFTS